MSESDSDELDAIREQKREELLRARDGDPTGEDTTESPDAPIHVDSAAHFDEVVNTHRIVLVDYYADWCGPCQMLEPIVEQVARETPAAVAKVDVDRQGELATRAGVRGVPTLLLFVDGEQVNRLVGVQDQGTLMDLIERHA